MILKDEFINEVKIKLHQIIENDNDLLFKDISNKISDDYYFKYAFNDYFFKIATCNNFHYKPLCNEIRLGNINFAHQLLKPQILFTYYSENIVVKIEERIDSVPLANKRDDFSTKIDCDKTKLIEKIKLISEVKLEFPRFNRKVKIFKYIDECADLLNPTIIQKCVKIADYSVEDNLVFSHGDLIPGNILVSGDDFIFVHGKAIGYSKTACEDCSKYKDEAVMCIAIDEAKSEPNNPYRTGQIVGVCKDFQLFVDKPEFIIKTENGVPYCFVEENVGKQIGFFK